MFASREVRAFIPRRDDAHLTDTYGSLHLRIEYGTVIGEIHPAYIISTVCDVVKLNPCPMFSVCVHIVGGIITEYLVDLDVLCTLSEHRDTTRNEYSKK